MVRKCSSSDIRRLSPVKLFGVSYPSLAPCAIRCCNGENRTREIPMKGVVVCPQPRAADAGAAVLSDGGTAFDAALAAAFAQMICDPFMCGLGGMGTLHYFRADTGESGMIDFHARAGAKVTPDMWAADSKGRTEVSGYSLFDDFRSELGYTSIMTPGTPAGFGLFHEMLCSRPWAELLQPAIDYARNGLPMTPYTRRVWTRYRMEGIPDGMTRIKASDECARVYLHPEDRLYNEGELFKLPDYADTLERLAETGPEDFYRGELAKIIADDLAENGSYVTAEDLANYKPQVGPPLEGQYRGLKVRSNSPPGSGATLIEMLQILDHVDLESFDHTSVDHLDAVGCAMAAAHVDRNEHLGDPDYTETPTDLLISKERAAMWAERIKAGEIPNAEQEAPPSCTTHLCVYDAAGNAVSVTHTLGTSSGVTTPGLGFTYNNSMKLFDPFPGQRNSMEPGKARTTGMVPTMVLKDGKPILIAGAPGGSVIISAVLQSILNVVDFGMSAVEAVTVPRIHCEGKGIHAEATVPLSVVEGLGAKGHTVNHKHESFAMDMSMAHVIAIGEDGTVRGGADPRAGGGIAYAR
ncbi:MAG: gamma-glutamyltransferase [Rhodospirillaceae bacterium]|nr:gamma-glutamyltransferase [Rhodospirillaceae bacterium]HAA93522.1 gamma-glutamyltransferase [Rhodospirillaceae bacterium]